MAVTGFTSRQGLRLARLRLALPIAIRTRSAGEADPLPTHPNLLNDDPIPTEHTSPEDVSPSEPEDGIESFEHEVRRIDPNHFEDVAPTRKSEATLADQLSPAPTEAAAPDVPPAAPHAADPTQPAAPEAPAAPPAPSAPAAGAAPGQAPSVSAGPGPNGPQPGGSSPGNGGASANDAPIFDFENGLDPASRGLLVNDWQTNVDPKLFSRHTNVIKISQQGNQVTFVVMAYNTDSSSNPDLSTGYAADGIERGELMTHLREVFQPTGPAIGHIAGIYNDFLEEQADTGAMSLLRIKPAGSSFQFMPQDRSIEGWSEAGLGREPTWQATPYTVYTVALTIQFIAIGSGQPQQSQGK